MTTNPTDRYERAARETRMKYFIDTEFIESGPSRPIELLSIGIVCEDGREFYVVNDDADLSHANDWVKANVIPHLGSPRVAFSKIGPGIIHWMRDPEPEFWGYYADYDWVVFCQLFGSMVDLPKGWPMYCRDLKQLCDSLGNPKLPAQSSTEHNALNDAKWNKIAYEFLAPAPSPGVPSEPPAKRMMRDRTTGYPHVYSPDCRGLGCFDYEREPAALPARPELDKAEGMCVHGEGKTALIDLPWPKFQCECCGLMSTERSFPIGWVQLGESSRGNGKTLASYCESCKSS